MCCAGLSHLLGTYQCCQMGFSRSPYPCVTSTTPPLPNAKAKLHKTSLNAKLQKLQWIYRMLNHRGLVIWILSVKPLCKLTSTGNPMKTAVNCWLDARRIALLYWLNTDLDEY